MIEKDQKILNNFETKLRHFIQLHLELKAENKALLEQLEQKECAMELLIEEKKKLQQNYNSLQSVLSLYASTGDFNLTKNRIAKLVRDIDKCITLLNQPQKQ